MTRLDFTLKPKPKPQTLTRRVKMFKSKWKSRIHTPLFKLQKKINPTQYPQILLSTFTHILLFYYIALIPQLLTPHTFIDRLLTFIASIGIYYLSQTILLKSFKPYKPKYEP